MKPVLKLKTHVALLLAGVFLAVGALSAPAAAFEIKDTTSDLRGDFVLEPAKIDVSLKPGQSVVKKLSVTNRVDRVAEFNVEIEDFSGSKDPNQTIVLLGRDKGPYSLRDYILPEVTSFTLQPRQRITFDVRISLPADATPGGKYGSVLISTRKAGQSTDTSQGSENKAQTISRVGALFFLRVEGAADENGSFDDFRISGAKRLFYTSAPTAFESLFANNGNVHLIPSGTIEIRNFMNRKIDEVKIDPFYVLPNSLRSMETEWKARPLFGRYTAVAKVSYGYQNEQEVVSERMVTFWVVPWKLLAAIIVVAVLFVLLVRYMRRRFEIRRRG